MERELEVSDEDLEELWDIAEGVAGSERQKGEVTVREYAALKGISERTARERLEKCVRNGTATRRQRMLNGWCRPVNCYTPVARREEDGAESDN